MLNGPICATSVTCLAATPRMRSWSCSARLTATALAFSRPVDRPAASTPARTATATIARTAALTMTSINA
jgi:hypothetical protein